MLMYIITQSTSRSHIGAGIRIIDQEELIRIIKGETEKKGWRRDSIRYGEVNVGYTDLLKFMSLETFEANFDPSVFTPEQVTEFFRSEISEKYGIRSVTKTMKRIPKSELEVGRVYLTENKDEYIYLGRVKETIVEDYPGCIYRSKFNETIINEGYGHIQYYKNDYTKIEEWCEYGVDYPIKNPKKFIEATDIKFEVPKNYHIDQTYKTIDIEFLDV